MESKMKYVFACLMVSMLSALIACSDKDKPVSDEDDPGKPGTGFTKLSPGVGNINTVFFVNDSTGYVCGDQIARTTDRGNTFTRFTLPDTDFHELYFTDAAHGWALQKDKLYKTVDSGRTWTSSAYPIESPMAIQFLTHLKGYIAGKGGIFKTTDGGNSWTNFAIFTDYVHLISFYHEDRGWFVSEGKKPEYTIDGGATFGAGVWATDTIRSFHFSSRDNGWQLGKNGTLAFSTDAGGSWWSPQPFGADAHHMEFPEANAGYVLALYSIHSVDNKGKKEILKCPDQPLTDMHFTDTRHGWAVSPAAGGILYRYVKP